MVNSNGDFSIPDLAAAMDGFRDQMRQLNEVQAQREQLTAKATVRKCVTVTVNADGQVVDTSFAARVEELSYTEIAEAVTEAARKAAAEAMRKATELMAPLYANHAQLPKLEDFLPGLDELAMSPGSAPWSATLEDGVVDGTDPATAPERGSKGGGVTDTSW